MPAFTTRFVSAPDHGLWDGYVRSRPDASLFHLYGWREVIQGTYGHKTYYLMVVANGSGVDAAPRLATGGGGDAQSIVGVLPLVHLKHIVFGSRLVSLPFVDGGGILASHEEAERSLLSEVRRLGREVGADRIELRQEHVLASCDDMNVASGDGQGAPLELIAKTNKVLMLLNLPESSDMLMKSFKAKLRSQIARPIKQGMTTRSGGAELLDDFYKVFVVNMRDLGSPVHSLQLMQHVLGEFPERSRIFVVYNSEEPVASALTVGFDKVLRNPWASSLRKYASLSPNMLLYLRMLEYACDKGYRVFDFGRSTPGEGTYRFKEQWGAVPSPLHWYTMSPAGKTFGPGSSEAERFKLAARCWSKLPLALTRLVGPRIRKHISL